MTLSFADINECAEYKNPCGDTRILYRNTCINTSGGHRCIDYHIPEVMLGKSLNYVSKLKQQNFKILKKMMMNV